MSDTIALIVAGSGEVSEKEVFDLIEDWYQGTDNADVSLVVPINKPLNTDAVEFAVNWYLDDEDADPKDILTVKEEGASMSRTSAGWGDGAEEVEKFEDIFKDEFKDFDRVEFFIALPEEDAKDYEEHVAWLEAADASKAKVTIRNLCRGLDDVVLTEPEEAPAAEPEPEPEKPARRGRSRKAKEEPAPEPEEEPVAEEPEEKPARKSRAKKSDPEVQDNGTVVPEEVLVALGTLRKVDEYLWLSDASFALFHLQTGGPAERRPLSAALHEAVKVLEAHLGGEPVEAPEAPEEPTVATSEPSGAKRGRPRTNFEVKEIFDEDEGAWVPRPRGRIAKGTKWRVRDDRDDTILDEGRQV